MSRSGLWLASQPWRPLGPSRPRLTGSQPRPRTPTMRLPATPISSAQPFEQSTQADCTHFSAAAIMRLSVRSGHWPSPAYGMREPQMSSMLLRVSAAGDADWLTSFMAYLPAELCFGTPSCRYGSACKHAKLPVRTYTLVVRCPASFHAIATARFIKLELRASLNFRVMSCGGTACAKQR